jgi:hypothetical protein
MNLLQEMTILPSQYRQTHALSPELALLRSLLDDAYLCLQGAISGFKSNVNKQQRKHEIGCEAYDWFLSNEVLPYTFLWTCDQLGLGAEHIRASVRKLYAKDLTRGQ